MQGPDPADPLTANLPPSTATADLKLGVKDLRLARLPDSERAEFDPDILAAYDRSLRELAAMGAEIVDLPAGGKTLRESGDLVGRIISAECYPRLAELVDNESLPLDEAVRVRVRAGAGLIRRETRAGRPPAQMLKGARGLPGRCRWAGRPRAGRPPPPKQEIPGRSRWAEVRRGSAGPTASGA